MYFNRMISVGKAANGFVVECNVPFKPKKEKESDCCCMPSSCGEKQYIAKDEAEVATLIGKLMPLLDAEYTNEKEFDIAFGEAAKGVANGKGA